MRQSARLIFNTAVMFSRMALTFGIGLYATRVLVNVLGHSDFGLLTTLGATGTLITFFGYSLNQSAQRYLARELGRADHERLVEVFNSTLALFVAMSFAVMLIGLTIERPLLDAIQIPLGRETAALWVYRLTLLNLVTVTAITPFRSVVNARQAMGQIAVFETVRSVLHLGAVLLLLVLEGDTLILYAALLLSAGLLRSTAMAVVCAIRFPESRPRLSRFRRTELIRVGRFAGWATLIGAGTQLHRQAAVVLLGMGFSPVITAAYGVAMRISSYHTSIARVIPRVVQPAMTTLEARGDRAYVQELALMTGKYSALGVLFLVIPVIAETEGILRLWLIDVPPDTSFFVRLTFVWLTVHTLTTGFEKAAFAHGSLARYALLTTGIWLLSLIVAAVLIFRAGFGAEVVPLALLGAALAQVPVRVGYVGSIIGLGYGRWLRETVWPALVPAAAGAATVSAVHASLPDTGMRYAAVVLAYAVVAIPLIWFLSVGQREKRSIRRLAASALPRLRERLAL